MKAIKIIILIFIVLLLGGCAASLVSLGNTVNHDQNTSNRVAQHWSEIYVGQTEAEVSSILGKPDDQSSDEIADPLGGSPTKMDMWMYGTLSDQTYSVSFTNGVVDSKGTL
jgi:uncharacterized protein YceK